MIINQNDRILIVSPHPDDESIGCGGVLCLYRRQCDVLLATDGYREESDNKEQSGIRVKEFHKTMDLLNVGKTILMHIPERRIQEHLNDFLKIDFNRYKYVLVPNRYEEHFDHRQLFLTIKKALRKQKSNAEMIEYEVWTTIRRPNIKIDISGVIEEKKKAILSYNSQVKDLDYAGMIIGLNAYRGKSRGCDYAETFYSEKKARFKRKKDRRKQIKSLFKGK